VKTVLLQIRFVKIIADLITCKRSNRLSGNQFSQDTRRMSESAIFRRPWYPAALNYGLTEWARFVGEESYSKGSSKEYLIDDSPTWCKSRNT